MILVADSGSTKTEWAFAGDIRHIEYVRTSGYNPYFDKDVLWREELSGWLKERAAVVKKVYYYGAGCDREEIGRGLEDVLKILVPGAQVRVEDDLSGAARALYGMGQGIALILGTGTNAGLWDGRQISKKSMTVGYLLGDHGSGAVMGLRFVRAWLDGDLPDRITTVFLEKYALDREKIKQNVYRADKPNYYLATFAPFLLEHIGEGKIREIVTGEFRKLFRVDLVPLAESSGVKEVRATGSIAWYFREILQEVAREYGMEISRIVQLPLQEMTLFHLRYPEEA